MWFAEWEYAWKKMQNGCVSQCVCVVCRFDASESESRLQPPQSTNEFCNTGGFVWVLDALGVSQLHNMSTACHIMSLPDALTTECHYAIRLSFTNPSAPHLSISQLPSSLRFFIDFFKSSSTHQYCYLLHFTTLNSAIWSLLMRFMFFYSYILYYSILAHFLSITSSSQLQSHSPRRIQCFGFSNLELLTLPCCSVVHMNLCLAILASLSTIPPEKPLGDS